MPSGVPFFICVNLSEIVGTSKNLSKFLEVPVQLLLSKLVFGLIFLFSLLVSFRTVFEARRFYRSKSNTATRRRKESVCRK